MGGTEFTVLAALFRWVYLRPALGDRFGLPPPIDWPGVVAATVGVAGAVAGGWLVYGPDWLPWWAALGVAYAAGEACERLAERWGSRA